MIKLGSQEVTKIMKGSQEVITAYKGGDEVWSAVKGPDLWSSTVALFDGTSAKDKTGIHTVKQTNSTYISLNQSGPTSEQSSMYFQGRSKGAYWTFARKAESTFEADFTIEFWVKVQSTSGQSYPCVFGNVTSTFSSGAIGFYASHANGYSGGFSLALDGKHPVGGNTPYTVGQWCHIAIVRQGTAMRTFKDGKLVSTPYSSSKTIGSTSYPNWIICNSLNTPGQSGVDMYITDFRMVKDTAVYWDDFTPPGPHPIGENPGFDADLDKVFSTFLYTGDRATERSINNNIDLLNNAGMVWTKSRSRSGSTYNHGLIDTLRGAGFEVSSDTTAGQSYDAKRIRSWEVDGYKVGQSYRYNDKETTYVSWTFLKEKCFFDMQIVNLPGGHSEPFTFSHDLGVKPGMVFLKRVDSIGSWNGYVAELGNSKLMYLNSNGYASSDGDRWRDPTDKEFTVGPDINDNGEYIAYLFADDKTDESVIKHGKYTGNGSTTNGPKIDLGWEPQWVMVKRVTRGAGYWMMADTKRGMASSGPQNYLAADTDTKETDYSWITATPTGFTIKNDGVSVNASGSDYIYMAIRKDQSAFMRRLEEEKDSE